MVICVFLKDSKSFLLHILLSKRFFSKMKFCHSKIQHKFVKFVDFSKKKTIFKLKLRFCA